MRSPESSTSDGIALVATLFLSLGVALLAATLFAITFLDGWMAANHAAGEQAFHAAEAGIERALGSIPPAPDFAAELGWAVTGPPFAPIIDFPRAPLSYRVTVVAADPGRIALRSIGTAARGSRREVEGFLCRDPAPRPLAAVVLGTATTFGVISGRVALDGDDVDSAFAPRPALAVEDPADAGGAAAIDPERRILPFGSGLGTARTALAAAADRTETGPFAAAVFGTAGAPAVVRLTTSAEIAGSSTANGILVAEAPLRVEGRLEVEGLLLAAAGVDVGGELVVRGAMHVDGSLDVAPAARLEVAMSSAAVAAADALRPGVLPRSAILCGSREVW